MELYQAVYSMSLNPLHIFGRSESEVRETDKILLQENRKIWHPFHICRKVKSSIESSLDGSLQEVKKIDSVKIHLTREGGICSNFIPLTLTDDVTLSIDPNYFDRFNTMRKKEQWYQQKGNLFGYVSSAAGFKHWTFIPEDVMMAMRDTDLTKYDHQVKRELDKTFRANDKIFDVYEKRKERAFLQQAGRTIRRIVGKE